MQCFERAFGLEAAAGFRAKQLRVQRRRQGERAEARRAADKKGPAAKDSFRFTWIKHSCYLVMVSFKFKSTLATAVIAANSAESTFSGAGDSPTLSNSLAAVGFWRNSVSCCSYVLCSTATSSASG